MRRKKEWVSGPFKAVNKFDKVTVLCKNTPMSFVYKSNKDLKESRNYVIQFLKDKKKSNPSFKVLDVGGGANSWANEVADAYLDIVPPPTSKKVFTGDINSATVWDQIQSEVGQYDFTICTHTLEDIRDPIFVLNKLMNVSKGGYISFPNKHTEFSNHESNFWTGAAHHRWIFTLKNSPEGEHLFFMPKWPGVAFFNPEYANWLVGLKRLFRLTNKDKNLTSQNLPWFQKNLSSDKNELGFIWQDKIPYKYHEYVSSVPQMLIDYREKLAEGL